MKLPLYYEHNVPKELNAGDSNAGLWYDKFCHKWIVNGGSYWNLKSFPQNKTTINPKAEWINTVTGMKIGKAERISEMNRRLVNMVEILKGKMCVLATEWRFVSGLGREHPVENGFAWHHTLGTPYLPGTSFKGVIRSWVENQEENYLPGDEKGDVINRIFGPRDKSEKKLGSVLFFDALPVDPVRLEAEIMTPHYSDYYRDKTPPADWLKPEPIQFLTVAPGQAFIFAVAPCHPEEEQSKKDVQKVFQWLEEALTWQGAGAKTAVGYGRFVQDLQAEQMWEDRRKKQQREEKQQEQERIEKELAEKRLNELASMSQVRREMEEDGVSDRPNDFMEQLTKKWLPRLEEAEPAERLEIAAILAEWYRKNKPNDWKKPKGKNKDKVEKIKSVLM
ncbi:CRISPR-associated RAMP protein, Cmr6 family [Desulfofarcimen acetoxidans DSM 771]|uniref:CRISPR-associated RAMP protein, Cmr6 family n=1 Tax=Desulfofarcimen acetoxidans (strain ATCC 49208 / DSM 771 / KCTC 5769 / VKM B-1644 / 5575) TaxID=485916 RepID=C8W2P5_DESAS|nr:type III-B CRISPR module RAMP protein Cmr6 [Desulfofarcimen acetoxidans]ACV63729.1 CRISPR-associated RAMP protein, Cmr6 family [Desulfofarcimen acetoxidans DSM 771]